MEPAAVTCTEVAGCGVELEFAGADGARQRAGLAACSGVRFEDAAVARSFRWSRGQGHFPGWWWLATTGRHAKYQAIRRDAGNGMSGRAIERKHHVGRRTIIKALTCAEPPARKKIQREPAALNGVRDHINAMIDANPQITIAAIWARLADEHHITVAYPTLRTYVTRRRETGQDSGGERDARTTMTAGHRR